MYVNKLLFEFEKKLINGFIFINLRDFERVEQEEEHDLVPEEPEIRISREELLARYQVCKNCSIKNSINLFVLCQGC